MKWNFLLLLSIFFSSVSNAQKEANNAALPTNNGGLLSEKIKYAPVLPGVLDTNAYFKLLKNHKVAVVVNQTSIVENQLLPEFLLAHGIHVVKIFAPEHGIRGKEDAGATVNNEIDSKTQLPVISLYGKSKKPNKEQLKDVDIVIYDIQDVGVRFYTYISTLQYVMEACADNEKQILILDRPNPLGWVVDGPVLTRKDTSFVGMQPIPILYGMTPAEYAQMLLGEHWLNTSKKCNLKVISVKNYTHHTQYNLPIAPSPNLKNMAAIYLYPSLCLFEGTKISVGRGTAYPFQQFGAPELLAFKDNNTFTPQKMEGATAPLFSDKKCYGLFLANTAQQALQITNGGQLQLKWIIEAYKNYPEKAKFFNSFFPKLAGTQLGAQIESNLSEDTIRDSWKADLQQFKNIRSQYLLYPL